MVDVFGGCCGRDILVVEVADLIGVCTNEVFVELE